MKRWEYQTVIIAAGVFSGGRLDGEEFNSQLNDLGEQGWELVSSFAVTHSTNHQVVAVLKRALAASP